MKFSKFIFLIILSIFLLGSFYFTHTVSAEDPDPNANMDQIRKGHFGLDNLLILTGLCQDEIGSDKGGSDDVCDNAITDIRVRIVSAVRMYLSFVSLIALIFVLYGGVTWATAGGSPERVKKGKDILIWASIGLAITIAAWGLITAVMSLASQIV